jgi:ElaB/YqjD/DUF883 family membrane-anchored ribosome-binding protein
MTDTTRTREELAADFHSVMTDIEALLSATTNKAEGEATVLRSRIRDRLDNAKERIVDAEQEAVDRAKRAARATDTYVHSHPWQAVGAAAAVGLAIGVLLGRR